MKVFKVWLSIIFSWIFKFGAPLGVAYWKFGIYKEGVGGSFFFFIFGIIIIGFYIKIKKVIKKMKTTRTKTVVKGIVGMATGGLLYFMVSYIGTNFTELTWVVLTYIGGCLLSAILEFIAVNIDKDYCDEIGVI